MISTHLISEFEGLIDEFTILDAGRAVLTLGADEARNRYQKIRARFANTPPQMDLSAALHVHRSGRELEMVVNGGRAEVLERVKRHDPESVSMEALTLEEIFVATLKR